MGAALGYALTSSIASTWIVFTILGVGMALPYLALAYFPAWRSKLPKPGAWMRRLRQLLAFPLYATVIWLAWVLGAQLDNDAVARLAATLLMVALALWAWQTMRTGGARAWGAAAIASLAAALIVGWPVAAGVASEGAKPAVAASEPWQDYTPQRVALLVAAGQPVFVDFTAAWCVTCQVNKRLVLNTDAVRQAFAQGNVALVRADWTRRDAVIGAALPLGRDGVPVYVLYRRISAAAVVGAPKQAGSAGRDRHAAFELASSLRRAVTGRTGRRRSLAFSGPCGMLRRPQRFNGDNDADRSRPPDRARRRPVSRGLRTAGGACAARLRRGRIRAGRGAVRGHAAEAVGTARCAGRFRRVALRWKATMKSRHAARPSSSCRARRGLPI
jgi:hypothetical protein